MDHTELEALVIARRLRVPIPTRTSGDGRTEWSAAVARQLDVALLSVGFSGSAGLLRRLSDLPAGTALDVGVRVLAAVRRLVGDHVQHNPYFRDFPENVPDTLEFWVERLAAAMLDPVAAGRVEVSDGALNLLSLPEYGTYQHSYEEMLAAHDELVASAGDRVTVLDLGDDLEVEAQKLYESLAGSEVPLAAEGLTALEKLAEYCVDGPQPERIGVRENRAVINRVRVRAGEPPLVDTVTDVLRLACALSGGDVTLAESTRFGSFRRVERRRMLEALNSVVEANQAKLGDVSRFAERWKRLGERLHPHEYPRFGHAAMVFDVARGDRPARGFGARVEEALTAHRIGDAVRLLESAPGALLRRLDHLLRSVERPDEASATLAAAHKAAPQASARVLLGLRQHLQNRNASAKAGRVFANRSGRAWARPDDREPLPQQVLDELLAMLDEEIGSRLEAPVGRLVCDPEVLDVALPLSGKATAPGLGMLPRGSIFNVTADLLRFFVYWRQARHRTDYDLSVLMLDSHYGNPVHVSWTSYKTGFATYSGDLTEAPDGATEFVDVRLAKASRSIVVPQVHIYAGDGFDQAAEAFFGFMAMTGEQQGRPFEPRTVRAKSDLRGAGRVAVPLVFLHDADHGWRAKWLHLYQKGRTNFNQVEATRVTTSRLVRSVVEHDYLTVGYLTALMRPAGDAEPDDGPVTYIGLEAPPELPDGSRVYTLDTLHELIPA